MPEKVIKRSAAWFEQKLYDYFIRMGNDYLRYAEFYTSPRPDQYVFDMPDRKQRIILTCDTDGLVNKKTYEYNKAGQLRLLGWIADLVTKDSPKNFFETVQGIGHPKRIDEDPPKKIVEKKPARGPTDSIWRED